MTGDSTIGALGLGGGGGGGITSCSVITNIGIRGIAKSLVIDTGIGRGIFCSS
jgi:hypothetical protein